MEAGVGAMLVVRSRETEAGYDFCAGGWATQIGP